MNTRRGRIGVLIDSSRDYRASIRRGPQGWFANAGIPVEGSTHAPFATWRVTSRTSFSRPTRHSRPSSTGRSVGRIRVGSKAVLVPSQACVAVKHASPCLPSIPGARETRQTGRVLPPEVPLSYVPAHHVGRAVAGLGHDDTFGGAAGRGARRQPGSERMAGVALGVQANGRGPALDDARHRLVRQPLWLHPLELVQ